MPRSTPGNYVPLDVNYPSDARVRAAGDAAELLWVRGLAYCKRTKTDGFVPEYDLPVVGVGLRNMPKRVAALVNTGLWEKADGGYRVRSWSKWNQAVSREEAFHVGQSAAGSKGNHERWHVGRGVSDGDCGWCEATRIPDRVADSGTGIAPESPLREGKGREGNKGDQAPIPTLAEQPARNPAPRTRGCRIPDDYRPGADLIEFARQRGLTNPQIVDVTAEFIDYWRGIPGAKGVKLDWDGTWRNWVRKQTTDVRPLRRAAGGEDYQPWNP